MVLLGHYNPLLLSAEGNVIFPYHVHISFLMATSLGATILISHCIGADDIPKAKRYSEVSFFYNTVISVLFFVYIELFTPSIINLLGTPDKVHSDAVEYMRILSYSFLFLGIEYSVTAVLQGMGLTRHIMFAGILRTIINVFLGWVMIFGRMGFPEMGIRGAALATTISNYFAAVYFIVTLVTSRKLIFRLSLIGILKPKWSIQKDNIKVGFPSGLEAILWSVGQIAIIRIVNELDAYSSGLYVLISRIQAFAFFIYIGIARATMILVGQKMGAGKPKEAVHVTMVSLRYAFMLCIIIAALFITMPDKILSLFTSEVKLIDRVSFLMYLISFTIFPVAINVIIGNAIRGMKDTKWMFYTQSFGTCFTICMSAVMIFVFRFNLLGVFVTVLMDESIRAVLNFLRFNKVKRIK
jgi:putative MATE family efflux protein